MEDYRHLYIASLCVLIGQANKQAPTYHVPLTRLKEWDKSLVRFSSVGGPDNDELQRRDKTPGEKDIRKLTYTTHDSSIHGQRLRP